MKKLFISEVFASVQGEGALVGVPSVFVRTSGCNLRCEWCDTPYASWEPEGEHVEVEALVARIEAHRPVRHAVLTGGEPMIAPHLGALAERLSSLGYHITVETAGTVFAPVRADLFSISPKLGNSTPRRGEEAWRARHEAARLNPAAIRAMMGAAEYQLKFVVSAPEDLAEIDALLVDLNPEPSRVLLMPEGRSVEQLDAGASWLVEVCMRRGWRFCDRLQIRLFGDTRGT